MEPAWGELMKADWCLMNEMSFWMVQVQDALLPVSWMGSTTRRRTVVLLNKVWWGRICNRCKKCCDRTSSKGNSKMGKKYLCCVYGASPELHNWCCCKDLFLWEILPMRRCVAAIQNLEQSECYITRVWDDSFGGVHWKQWWGIQWQWSSLNRMSGQCNKGIIVFVSLWSQRQH